MLTRIQKIAVSQFILTVMATTASSWQIATAQTPPTSPRPEHTRQRGPLDFVKALGLDEARATELRSILDDSMDARHTLMKQMHNASTAADKEAARSKLRVLHEATHKEIAAILSPEELAQFEKLMPRPPRAPKQNDVM